MGYIDYNTKNSNYYNYGNKLLPVLGSAEAEIYVTFLKSNKKTYNPTPENKGNIPFMFVGGYGSYNYSTIGTISNNGQSGPFRSSGVTSPC